MRSANVSKPYAETLLRGACRQSQAGALRASQAVRSVQTGPTGSSILQKQSMGASEETSINERPWAVPALSPRKEDHTR